MTTHTYIVTDSEGGSLRCRSRTAARAALRFAKTFEMSESERITCLVRRVGRHGFLEAERLEVEKRRDGYDVL